MTNQRIHKNILQCIFVLFLFSLNTVRTDIPVHCLLKDVQGKWDFMINTNTFNPSLENEEETSCGHGFPNKVVEIPRSHKLSFPSHNKITLDLKPDFTITEDGHFVGNWSFVYDQSLLIKYKHSILTAPFKYYKQRGNPEADSDCSKTFLGWYIPRDMDFKRDWSCFYALKADQNSQTNSGQGFTGFLEIEGQSKKEKMDSFGDFMDNTLEKEIKSTTSQNNNFGGFSFVQTHITNRNAIENTVKYEQLGKVVQKINKLNLGWEADINPRFIGMSFAQVKSELGLNKGFYNNKNNKSDKFSFIQMNKEITKNSVDEYLRSVEKEISDIENNTGDTVFFQTESKTETNLENKETTKQKSSSKLRSKENTQKSLDAGNTKECNDCVPKIPIDKRNPDKVEAVAPDNEREKNSSEVNSYQEVSKYLHTDINDIDETKLPKIWDWRNVGGKNYLTPVRNQGHCGSCYVFSTMASLESRLRIQTDFADKTVFSRQYPLSCNFYSEGCDGGYPVLVSKFSKEFELVPEDCFEYTETNSSCSKVCDFKSNPKKYSVSEYGYLGGAYGKTNEAQMMKEIRARGPMPGNILVHWSFQYYKRGIFAHQNQKRQNSKEINLKDLFDYGMSWAKVEHSITLVGYGEEDGVKYWIGMNTWGSDWGDNGFFKILRGENEAMIESMGDFMNVKVEDRK